MAEQNFHAAQLEAAMRILLEVASREDADEEDLHLARAQVARVLKLKPSDLGQQDTPQPTRHARTPFDL